MEGYVNLIGRHLYRGTLTTTARTHKRGSMALSGLLFQAAQGLGFGAG
jgi:hypothetical protein